MRWLRLAPWRRGPTLLLRRPGVAVALFAAALVATLPAAAAPLFLSSAEHATLHRQITETCPWRVGGQVNGPIAPSNPLRFRPLLGPDSVVGVARYQGRKEVLAAHAVPGLSAPVSTAYGDLDARPVDRPLPLPDLAGIRLLTREGFEQHVEVVEGPVGQGLWIPHEHAEQQGLRVGDLVRLTPRRALGTWQPPEVPNVTDRPLTPGPSLPQPEPEPVVLPVAAIYRDLRTLPRQEFWCGVEEGYLGTPQEQANANISILPMVLVDEATFLTTGERTLIPATQIIEYRLTDPTLTAPEAAAVAARLTAVRDAAFADHPKLFPATDAADRTQFDSLLDRYQRRAALVRTGLLPPVLPITAAGTLVGLAVTSAAALFWVQRRRRELAVLAAHGVTPAGLGVKAVVEALPAVLAGTVAGWLAALGLVVGVGPARVLAPAAPPAAALAAAGVGLVALLLIGALAAGRTRELADARPVTHRGGWWRRVPWELLLVAGAPVAWLLLTSDQVIDEAAGGVGRVAHVPARLLVTPILAIVGGTLFAGRLAARWLARHGRLRTPTDPARFLAWRRSARAALATAVLAIATAVPVAMAVFGATATNSIRTTADAELRFGLGSDTVVSYPTGTARRLGELPPPPPPPAAVADRATEVLRLNQQQLDGVIVDVLAVDPDTFRAGAFWDERIPGPSLADAVARLGTGSPATVVASRRFAPGPATLYIRDEPVPVEVVATRPLPGAQSSYPMVMIHRDLLDRLEERGRDSFTPQLWIAGDPTGTLAAVAAAELPVSRISTVDDQRVGAVYEPVTYTFQYLMALSVFTGLIGAVGLLLYLESRTAAHRRAYVMLRRLGLRAGTHRRALLLEVGVPVLVGLAAGLAGAVGVAYAVRAGLDVNPERFPGAVIDLPGSLAVLITVTAVILAVAAGLVAHRRIARANPTEVLRDTV